MKRPVIGCTEPSAFQPYVIDMIEKFYNANPFKLCQNNQEDLEYWLSQCDAVILSGGNDIHPRVYGQPVLNDCNFSKFDVPRDIRELRIIRYCIKNKIPMLGICRGHQMLGAFHRIQFIPDLGRSPIVHQPRSQQISCDKDEPMHWIALTNNCPKAFQVVDKVASDLFIGEKIDPRYLWVNSFHHQGLRYAKDIQHVKVLAVAPGIEKDEKIIELMMDNEENWISTQFHPEYDWNENVVSLMVLKQFEKMIAKKVG